MTLITYFKIFYSHLGSGILYAISLSTLATLLEGLGIFLVLPLLTGIDSSDSVINSYLKAGFDFFYVSFNVTNVILLIMFVFIIKGIINFISLSQIAKLKGSLLKKLKLGLFNAISAVDYQHSISKDSGYFSNVVNEQVVKSLQAFYTFSQSISQSISAFIYIGFALLAALEFGIIAIAVGCILFVMFKKLNLYVRLISKERAKQSGDLAAKLIEFIQSLKYLKATGQLNKLGMRVKESIDVLTNLEIKNGVATAFTQSIREPIAVILIMVLIYINVYFLNQPLEPIFISVVLFYRSLNSFFSVQGFWQSTMENIGSMDLVDSEKKQLDFNVEEIEPSSKIQFSNEIMLDTVSFEYGGSAERILNSVSIIIKKGQTVAFVGHSGSGKSTLIDLIMGTLKPTSGQILVDSVVLSRGNAESWRDFVGLVPQLPVLFRGSICSNISMNFDSDDIDVDRVKLFAKKAYIDHFIDSLPLRYETNVGEKGVHLSGGQSQRICIARELYRETELLVFDEATSALDYESERMIKDSINALKGKVTTIIVAHRLSTIKNADVIYVIDKGCIAEFGSYETLVSKQGSIFSSLVGEEQ